MLNLIKHLRDVAQGKTTKRKRRSPKWRTVRAEHLERKPRCAVCDGTSKVEVHHIIPFHVAPELELEPANLLTLCERKKYGLNCHQLVGHLGNYRRANPDVRCDASTWRRKIRPDRSCGA